ncbi:hypothetical protein FBFL15_0778 [Sporocytophaga myxococcoides]|uniref:TIGR04222 domain-containing membrane protein n=1 Tax=Sporocytophaga myxococcoides TaxID=153721 RepID=A0A098LD39_9BACT|nr:hypothetical protein [Sporocytophaga myxococcoides]GAL84820.1 hypothetical protein FBFL15_0778 [Sporocytophaga myxococcoides]
MSIVFNTSLWKSVENFALDEPTDVYGFSTRLANENKWTINFAMSAILEYKKFMYLAATSDKMVSPSEIVDVVWHQHLVFTKSYNEFCNLLGRKIEHVPSTHNSKDHRKFAAAKERTKVIYEETFGKQPEEIWNYTDIYGPLSLPKASINLRTFLLIGIFAFVILATPCYYLFRPLVIQIGNPYYMWMLLLGCGASFSLLDFYNKRKQSEFLNKLPQYAFLKKLTPVELIYAENCDLSPFVDGIVSRMIEEDKINVSKKYRLKNKAKSVAENIYEFVVKETLKSHSRIKYNELLRLLKGRHVFSSIAGSMDAFQKYYIKSKFFGRLYYMNFAIISMVFMSGTVRLFTGISREKPVFWLVVFLIAYLILTIFFLKRLTKQILKETIPDFYKASTAHDHINIEDWDWKYFMAGPLLLAPTFISARNAGNESNSLGGDGSSSGCGSGGSSCGSSCSSCGGCGGD